MVDVNPMPIADRNGDAARDAAFEALQRRLRPAPLRAAEIEAWGAAVDMDPDAMTELRAAIQAYRDSVRDFDIDATDRYAAQIEATHRWNRRSRTFEPIYTPEHLRLLEMQWQTIEHLRNAERELMSTFVGLTEPAHRSRAQRLVFARLFEVVAVPTTRSSAAINIAAIVDSMHLDDDLMHAITPHLDTYVQRVTAALGWRTEAAFGLERDRVQLHVDLGPLWTLAVDEATRDALNAEMAEIAEALMRTELPISGLNQEALQTLSRALPSEQAAELRRRFWRLVNPELHREESELTTLILASMGNDGIAAADITGREALLQTLQATMSRLGFDAADLEDVARSIDPTRSRADALRHISVELERLDAVRRRREALLGAASNLESMLTTSEVDILHGVRTWAVAVRRRDAADRWIADRLSGLVNRLMAPPPRIETNDDDRDREDESDDRSERDLDGDRSDADRDRQNGAARPRR